MSSARYRGGRWVSHIGVVGEVGGDLSAGVAASHHNHPAVGEVLWAAVLDGVQLTAAEVPAAGDGGQGGAPPCAGRADRGASASCVGVGLHAQELAVAADASDAYWPFDGNLVPLLVVGEVVHCLLGVGVLLVGMRRPASEE